MKELKEAVKVLMHEEYERAAERFGEKFNSPHEAYAVILEEMEEANAEFEFMGADMNWLWRFIKKDERHNAKKFLKNIYTQNLFADNLNIPSSNGSNITQFNQEIRPTLNTDSLSTILSETAIFNAINNKLSLATTVKDGMIPMLPTDGELYYLNGDNLWIEKEWVVSTIDGKKYLSTGVGDFKSFNVSLIANG